MVVNSKKLIRAAWGFASYKEVFDFQPEQNESKLCPFGLLKWKFICTRITWEEILFFNFFLTMSHD